MENSTHINIIIGIAYVVMFAIAMAATIFYFYSRAKLFKSEREKQIVAFRAAVQAEEKQKERIANNLHDTSIPLLTVIAQNFDKYAKKNPKNQPTDEEISGDKQVIYDCIESIRTAALELIPKVLLDLGLVRALKAHVKKIDTEVSAAEFENNTDFDTDLPFTKAEEVNIYRTCLEVLQNLQKHDQYTYLKLALSVNDKHLLITFLHDGKGVSNQQINALSETSAGLGLKSLQSRMLILKASINYLITPDAAKIEITIPFSL